VGECGCGRGRVRAGEGRRGRVREGACARARQRAEDYGAPVTSSMTGSEFRTAAMRAAVVGVPARGGRANTPPRVLAALAASPPPRPRVAKLEGSCTYLTDLRTPAMAGAGGAHVRGEEGARCRLQ
jgi:hypothetical protein